MQLPLYCIILAQRACIAATVNWACFCRNTHALVSCDTAKLHTSDFNDAHTSCVILLLDEKDAARHNHQHGLCHLSLLYPRLSLVAFLYCHTFTCVYSSAHSRQHSWCVVWPCFRKQCANVKPRSLSPGVKRYKQDHKLEVQARAHGYRGVTPQLLDLL